LRLAPPANPLADFPTDLQLAPSINLQPNFPADLSTRVSDQPSSSAFASTCDLRRLPILQPAFQLTSSLRLPSVFQLTYKPNLRLSSAAAFSGCLESPCDLRR